MGGKILERYILRDFFKALVLSLIAIVLIYLITDFFERIGFYVDRKVPWKLLYIYYFLHSFYVLNLIAPLAFLLGVYYSLGRLTKNNEVLAMRGLGISPFFIYRPIFAWGLILTLVFTGFNASVVPWSLKEKKRWWREKILKVGEGRIIFERRISMISSSGWYLYADRLVKDVMRGVDLILMDEGRIKKRIYARRAVYSDGVWKLEDVYIRAFGEKEVFTRKKEMNAPFIQETPNEILRKKERPEEMGIVELLGHIRFLKNRGYPTDRERLEFYTRFAYPFLCLILVIYGCPLSLEVKRKGLAYGLGWGLFLAFFFWGIVQLFRVLGQKGSLNPFLSAALPDIAFLSFGIFLMIKKNS